MTEFARPFKVTHEWTFGHSVENHGVQFPSGRCVLGLAGGKGSRGQFVRLSTFRSWGEGDQS